MKPSVAQNHGAAPVGRGSAGRSFDPCQATVGVVVAPKEEIFRFGRTGTAVLLLPTMPGERQRCSTVAPDALQSLIGDEQAAWEVFEAVRRLDRQRFDEWALAERQRDAHRVTSSWEQEYRQHGGDKDAGSFVEVTPVVQPSHAAMIACDPQTSADQEQHAYTTVLSCDMSAEHALIGERIRAALRRCEGRQERHRLLDGDELEAYWHLAARLGQEKLDYWCEDGRGRNLRLRVCQLTGRVFRGRSARFHPSLPREPVQAELRNHHVAAYVGPLYRPSDPFAPSSRAVRFYAQCRACGDLFTAGTGKREHCDACGSDAGRKARSRGRCPAAPTS